MVVFRGAEDDVLDRYVSCARAHELDAVVRATGDNPFVEPASLDGLVELFGASEAHYACALPSCGSGLPVGTGVEVMSREALEESWQRGVLPHHREHVDEYILEHPERFGCAVYQPPATLTAPELVLTVDTVEQFDEADQIWRDYRAQHQDDLLPLEWVIAWKRRHSGEEPS